MTVDIVPAILAQTKEEFAEKLRLVEGQVPLVQIDVVDGTFVPSTAYASADDVEALHPTFDVDVHLMTNRISEAIEAWTRSWVGKITFHLEAADHAADLLRVIHKENIGAALALNPETPAERLIPFLPLVESVLFLGVSPGRSGQPFQENVVEKIREFHAAHPDVVIGIDGGVSKERIPRLVAAGASQLYIASKLFGAEDPLAELRELEKLVEEKSVKT